jgi:hypothetical protein
MNQPTISRVHRIESNGAAGLARSPRDSLGNLLQKGLAIFALGLEVEDNANGLYVPSKPHRDLLREKLHSFCRATVAPTDPISDSPAYLENLKILLCRLGNREISHVHPLENTVNEATDLT